MSRPRSRTLIGGAAVLVFLIRLPPHVRRLDPLGHFVADVSDATATTGEQLQGHFTVVTTS